MEPFEIYPGLTVRLEIISFSSKALRLSLLGAMIVTLVNPMVLMVIIWLGLLAVLWCLYKAIR